MKVHIKKCDYKARTYTDFNYVHQFTFFPYGAYQFACDNRSVPWQWKLVFTFGAFSKITLDG
jgi:hypothetical protein